MSRVEQSCRRSLILSRRVESRCRWNGTGWDKRKEASHHIDPIQSWSDRYDMIYLPGMNWWMNDDNTTIYSTKVAAAGVENFVSTRQDKKQWQPNKHHAYYLFIYSIENAAILYQSMQSIIFFSRHAFVSLFLCSFVIPFFLFAFYYITSWNIICDTIIFIIYHAINIYIKYISLYLHGRHSMVERKTRRVWKSHEGIGYCQENGSLRNGFGTSQGDRVYQGLWKQIK